MQKREGAISDWNVEGTIESEMKKERKKEVKM